MKTGRNRNEKRAGIQDESVAKKRGEEEEVEVREDEER